MGNVALAALVGFLLGFLFAATVQFEVEKSEVAAGFTRVGRQAFRLVPLEPAR